MGEGTGGFPTIGTPHSAFFTTGQLTRCPGGSWPDTSFAKLLGGEIEYRN